MVCYAGLTGTGTGSATNNVPLRIPRRVMRHNMKMTPLTMAKTGTDKRCIKKLGSTNSGAAMRSPSARVRLANAASGNDKAQKPMWKPARHARTNTGATQSNEKNAIAHAICMTHTGA